jgi:hypothetical protein
MSESVVYTVPWFAEIMRMPPGRREVPGASIRMAIIATDLARGVAPDDDWGRQLATLLCRDWGALETALRFGALLELGEP